MLTGVQQSEHSFVLMVYASYTKNFYKIINDKESSSKWAKGLNRQLTEEIQVVTID